MHKDKAQVTIPHHVRSRPRTLRIVFPAGLRPFSREQIRDDLVSVFKRLRQGRVYRREAGWTRYVVRVEENCFVVTSARDRCGGWGSNLRNPPKLWSDNVLIKRKMCARAILIQRIQRQLPQLERLLDEVSNGWGYEESIYCYYMRSRELDAFRALTRRIVKALKALAPPEKYRDALRLRNGVFGNTFSRMLREGTHPIPLVMREQNDWRAWARPVVEAFLHTRFFLEMAVKCGRTIKDPQSHFPMCWTAFLALYSCQRER